MSRQALGALREDRQPSRLVVLYLGLVHVLSGMAFFLPFSYFMDTMVWRSYQRRLARTAEKK